MDKRLLVVDDDALLRNIIRRVLSRIDGVTVEVAVNGEEGLDRLRSDQFDVVVSDIHMPKRDGVSMAKDVLDAGSYNLRQFLFLCGRPNSPEWVVAESMGCRLMTKPFSNAELAATVQDMLATGMLASLVPVAVAGDP